MFPNGMEFMPGEHCQDLMLEAEKAQLIKEAGFAQSSSYGMVVKNGSKWLGSQLVKFGLMLQRYSTVPASDSQSENTNSG